MLGVCVPAARVVLLGLLAVLAAGCRMDLVAPIELRADGSAVAGLEARFDPRMLAELDALGVDPTAELATVVGADDAWTLTRTRQEDGGLTVALRRELADAAELPGIYAQLQAGLSSADPALSIDLERVEVAGGRSHLEGTATFRPPSTSGLTVDGEAVGEEDEELAALVEDAVAVGVEVVMPGPVEEHDGFRLERDTVRIELEQGQPRRFTVTSAPPPWWSRIPTDGSALLVLGGVVVILLGAVLVVLGRRRATPEA